MHREVKSWIVHTYPRNPSHVFVDLTEIFHEKKKQGVGEKNARRLPIAQNPKKLLTNFVMLTTPHVSKRKSKIKVRARCQSRIHVSTDGEISYEATSAIERNHSHCRKNWITCRINARRQGWNWLFQLCRIYKFETCRFITVNRRFDVRSPTNKWQRKDNETPIRREWNDQFWLCYFHVTIVHNIRLRKRHTKLLHSFFFTVQKSEQ